MKYSVACGQVSVHSCLFAACESIDQIFYKRAREREREREVGEEE